MLNSIETLTTTQLRHIVRNVHPLGNLRDFRARAVRELNRRNGLDNRSLRTHIPIRPRADDGRSVA